MSLYLQNAGHQKENGSNRETGSDPCVAEVWYSLECSFPGRVGKEYAKKYEVYREPQYDDIIEHVKITPDLLWK